MTKNDWRTTPVHLNLKEVLNIETALFWAWENNKFDGTYEKYSMLRDRITHAHKQLKVLK